MQGFKIAVLDKGFVYVGEVSLCDGNLLIEKARNIRVWGTTKGLGELARGGPTKKTVIDEVGEIIVPFHAIVHLITTDPEKWGR